MKRLKDNYLNVIQTALPFAGKRVLEIGCGNGARTIQIAEYCEDVVAIDPNADHIAQAKTQHTRLNIRYEIGSGDALSFPKTSFDLVFFTLSFHHIPVERMSVAIDEALRVVKSDGHLIFLEPAFSGSFFEAEILFNACDGDERKEKAAAYLAMLSHPRLQEIAECSDETIFAFDDLEDFVNTMNPKQNSSTLKRFLEDRDFTLNAERRINIFRPRHH